MGKEKLAALINDRVSQKASSIKITRQAENEEKALQAECEKWADVYGITGMARDDIFKLLERGKVTIKDSGEILGVKEQVETMIGKYPGICEEPKQHQAKERPQQIGGKF